ncbi:MAG: TlpA family protein disulfide reductase [Bacteroides intestinalis]|nr:TlpA family protein disulfide reductase [Bacteroides intestinalis]
MKFNSDYKDFFPLLEQKLKEIEAYTPSNTSDKEFDKVFEKYRRYDLMCDVLNFLNTPRSEHPTVKDFPAYLNAINLSEVTADPDILDFPYSIRLIDFVRRLSVKKLTEKASKEETVQIRDTYESLRRDLPQIMNSTVKGEVILETARNIKTFEELTQLNNEFGKFLVTESQKERMHHMLVDKADVANGQEAFDFKFKNADDKEIALSDFRGKVVYIDVWATWCGPCLKEIPHLKKLEADYKDKNIVFLGVSIDSQKDYTKWKEFLKQERLVGIQLFAGDKAKDISKPYKITGIPRFILVGKDGKIISADAPRPSSTEVRKMLDAALR